MARNPMIDKTYVLNLFECGLSAKEISKHTGYARSTVYNIKYSNSGHISPKENNPLRKKVIKLYSEGERQIRIAEIVGVSRQRVSQIIKGQ